MPITLRKVFEWQCGFIALKLGSKVSQPTGALFWIRAPPVIGDNNPITFIYSSVMVTILYSAFVLVSTSVKAEET